jgi:hypothetical protein
MLNTFNKASYTKEKEDEHYREGDEEQIETPHLVG